MTNEEIVTKAIAKAYEEVPEPTWSTRFKVFMGGVVLVLFANTGLSIYNTHELAQQQTCSIKQTLNGRVIAQDDRNAVDTMVNEIINAKSQAQVHNALQDYTTLRTRDEAKRVSAYSKKC